MELAQLCSQILCQPYFRLCEFSFKKYRVKISFINLFVFECREVECLEEDAPLFFDQFSGWPQETDEHSCVSKENPGRSQESIQQPSDCVMNNSSQATCSSDVPKKNARIETMCCNCVQLEIDLHKTKITLSKLQKRCHDKAAEIKRLRASEQRAKTAKYTLEEMIREMKQKKWISDEGQNVLNVI